jgi:hypothetical protein
MGLHDINGKKSIPMVSIGIAVYETVKIIPQP